MSQKIAIMGTHGTGKTTLSYYLAAHYKKEGKNVKIIQEVARNCPFPLNHAMSSKSAWWIYHEHSRKELEAIQHHDVVICDRSSIDSFIYAEYLDLSDWNHDLTNVLIKDALSKYSKIFFVTPDVPILEDGFRSTDEDFQKGIDKRFKNIMQSYPHTKINSSFIFKEEQSWKQYCLYPH